MKADLRKFEPAIIDQPERVQEAVQVLDLGIASVDYFKASGAKRCFDGEAMSFSVARTDCERSRYKTLKIGDWRDDPRFEDDDAA
jgi:hypothetical protein